MEVVSGNTLLPGDPRLIDHIVCELKSQGIFDQFRKECIADVDTKPAYQNLRQRVEGSVSGFLKTQTWSPDMNKNQLREMLRKNIYESGFLETGVERIVDQVVNPKINTVFLPQVEDVVYKFLGLEKPLRSTTNRLNGPLTINTFDLLPTDLDPISPDSEVLEKSLNKSDKSCETDKLDDSKMDDFESPPFELITEQSVFLPHEESSNDSHLSGISGLTSNSNMSDGVLKMTNAPDMMNQDSQLSKVSSNSHLSIITNDDKHSEKMDISDDTQTSKHSKVEAPGSGDAGAPENGLVFNLKEQVDMMQTNEAPEAPEAPLKPEEIKAEVNLDENSKHSEKQEEPAKDEADAKQKEVDKPKDEKQQQKAESKERSRKDSDRRSGSKYEKERKDKDKDKDRDRDKEKRDKDKSRSSSSSKDRDKYKDRKDSKSREKDKDSSKDSKDKDLKEKKDKNKDDKDTKKDEKKETKSEDKKDRDRDSKSERHRSSSSSKHSSRDRSKSDRKDSTSSSSRDKCKSDGKDSKTEKRPSDSKKSDGKSREDSSRSKERDRDRERGRSRSDSRRDSKSGSSRDKERRDSKKSSRKDKDDHSSLKDKKSDGRRSTDRDSNDGSSGNASSANKDSSDSKSKSVETSDNSQASGDSNQSGNTEPQDTEPQPATDASESTSTAADDGDNASFPEREETADGPQVKLRKPKFASNIFEARRLMKVRKKMEKRERKRQARLDQNLREAGNGDSLEEVHQPTETAGNVTETDDDKETSIEVRELIVTEVTSNEESKCEERAAEDRQEEVSVNSVVSKASWDALEAKLAQNMMHIDYNSYVDDTSDRSPGECSARGKSEDEDCLYFNPQVSPTTERYLKQIANIQKMGSELLEPSPKSGEPVKMAPPDSSNADRPSRRSRKPNLKYCSNDYTSEISFEEEADEAEAEAATAPQKKPRKRKLDADMDGLDADNNNKRIHAGFDGERELPDLEYEDEHEPSPCASNTSSSSVEHPLRLRQSKGRRSRRSDLTAAPVQSDQFPLPPSPESDISGHSFEARAARPEERETVPKARSASSSTKCQRYSSDDLYKPRPFVSGTRRTRGTLNTDQAAKDAR